MAAPILRIRKRDRAEASPKDGLRQGWTEYQVLNGRRIVSRHDTEEQARAWLDFERDLLLGSDPEDAP